jgi:hypothetical protein
VNRTNILFSEYDLNKQLTMAMVGVTGPGSAPR